MIPSRVFGSVSYVHLPKTQRTKLDPYVVQCVFLGYGGHKKGYQCYDTNTWRLYITLDVTFHESEMFFIHRDPYSCLSGENTSAEKKLGISTLAKLGIIRKL